MIKQGDVFVRRHPDGRFGAIRVLRVDGKSLMIDTTAYLDARMPQLEDADLRTPVEQKRFFFQGGRATKWLNGKPSSTFSFLFNIPLNEDEERIECCTYGGGWDEYTGAEVFLEWRWKHDREAFEAEVRADQILREEKRKEAALAQRPKRMMVEDDFWHLISLLDWSKTGNDDTVVEPLVHALSKLSKPEIKHFAERVAYSLYCLDTRDHARNIGSESYVDDAAHFSDDWFLYVRCAAVANGRDFYQRAVADPRQMPKDLEFEALLGVSSAAWEAKTGGEFDHESGCSYESFSNVAGWK